MTMKEEEVKNDRLAVSLMLAAKANFSFSRSDDAVYLADQTGITVKARLMQCNARQDYERVYMSMDKPNFVDWKDYGPELSRFYQQNFDAPLIAWADPEYLVVPISPSVGIYEWIHLAPHLNNNPDCLPRQDDRINSNTRSLWLPHVKVEDIERTNPHVRIGLIDFPFSCMMLREIVIADWEAYRYDKERFFQHCSFCNLLTSEMDNFSDKWIASRTGVCFKCGRLQDALLNAVPS